MDEYYILLIVVVILSVIAFFLSSFYVKKKTKFLDLEAKRILYLKNKKTRKLFSYFFLAYIFLNLIISLLSYFNVINDLSDNYQVYNICYTYILALIAPIGFFYFFNHYKLEKLVFGRIL